MGLTDSAFVRKTLTAGFWLYERIEEQLWPLYSSGVVVGALCLLSSMTEKTVVADHLCTRGRMDLQDQAESEIKKASQLMEAESLKSVKNYVWSLPSDEFQKLQAGRKTLHWQ